MANFSFFIYVTLVIFITSSSANGHANVSSHICDEKRYSNLGIDIKTLTFCNKSLPFNVRAKDLVDQMTLLEKVQQLGDKAKGVSRLGLPAYNWWSEALHGVSDFGDGATFFDDVVPGATSFPPPILTAASFNESLWKTIGQAVSTEARAMYNLGHAGLTFWSPNINVVRDPRWGRALETPGEDPFVAGTYASNYVRGLQDIEGAQNSTDLNSRLLKVGACCKHLAAYDVDNWLAVDRLHYDARVHEQDMVETFLPPFEMCVRDGDVVSVMCSYNKINGIPACADTKLLKDTVRGKWDLHGYIVSDCDSIEVMVDNQKWLKDKPENAVSQTLRAGLELDCGTTYTNYVNNAVVQGKVREELVDNALVNLYVVLMRLGLFDGNPSLKSLGSDNVCTKEHIELATEAAREGIVLLKNENQTLPLDHKKYKILALVGPHANATEAMIGNYKGIPCQYASPISAFSAYVEVKYAKGCGDILCKNETFISQAVDAARDADATVIFAGLDQTVEAEYKDRVDLILPYYQPRLIKQVSKVSKGPVILVVMSAGGVDISFAKNDSNIKAILWAGYPGEEGGQAIADVLFGKYNPGGRLPLTWYEANYTDQLPMTSMQLRPDDKLGYPGRTYKFFNGSTVYPFGYGLSYTQFHYKIVSSKKDLTIKLNKFQHCRDLNYKDDAYKPECQSILIDDLKCDYNIEFEIQVVNKGSRDGSEVVMVYAIPPRDIVGTPIKQLVGFKRVFVSAKKSQKVKFVLNVCKSLSIVNYNAYQVLAHGEHKIVIGDNVLEFPVEVNFQHSVGERVQPCR